LALASPVKVKVPEVYAARTLLGTGKTFTVRNRARIAEPFGTPIPVQASAPTAAR
jgi:hypothetical protein